jgi:hypothetical protein
MNKTILTRSTKYEKQIDQILDDTDLDDLDKMMAIQELEERQTTKADGVWDGKLGNPPLHPECLDYWEGYEIGLREYWLKKLDRTVTMEM